MIFSRPDPACDPYFAGTLLSLQRAAYTVEAELIGDDRIPPLQEGVSDLEAWRGQWVTVWEGVHLTGAIAWSETAEHLQIEKLMVAPGAARRGVGTALLVQVLEASAGRPIDVATGRDNVPAVALYVRHGFEHLGDEQVPPGIWVSRFRRA